MNVDVSEEQLAVVNSTSTPPNSIVVSVDMEKSKENAEETVLDENGYPVRARRPTYNNFKSSPYSNNFSKLVKVPNVIIMVGLPAHGKTYTARKLNRYLKWTGAKCKVFNLGDYRRQLSTYNGSSFFDTENKAGRAIIQRKINEKYDGNEFFNNQNPIAMRIRSQCAHMALADLTEFLDSTEGEVAIFDGTNTTRERRTWVNAECSNRGFRVLFVELVCDDPDLVEDNIQAVKVNSPDYRNMTPEQAKADFKMRIKHYENQYQPMSKEHDKDLSFLQVFNLGRSFYVRNVQGHVQSRVVYFLMNVVPRSRTLYFTRHGESEYNQLGRIGGDSPLSERGLDYARKLVDYFSKEKLNDLKVWSSQKIRTVQTAKLFQPLRPFIEHWKVLDEIDAGICEGLTYEEIQERYPEQFALRDKQKFHYRYPSGESYEDIVGRLEPVIMELERQDNVLVVSHQAVIRCLLAYFMEKDTDALPYIRVPLHTLIKLTPVAYGCEIEEIKFDVTAVDTHRPRPKNVDRARSRKEALATVPPYLKKNKLATPIAVRNSASSN